MRIFALVYLISFRDGQVNAEDDDSSLDLGGDLDRLGGVTEDHAHRLALRVHPGEGHRHVIAREGRLHGHLVYGDTCRGGQGSERRELLVRERQRACWHTMSRAVNKMAVESKIPEMFKWLELYNSEGRQL